MLTYEMDRKAEADVIDVLPEPTRRGR